MSTKHQVKSSHHSDFVSLELKNTDNCDINVQIQTENYRFILTSLRRSAYLYVLKGILILRECHHQKNKNKIAMKYRSFRSVETMTTAITLRDGVGDGRLFAQTTIERRGEMLFTDFHCEGQWNSMESLAVSGEETSSYSKVIFFFRRLCTYSGLIVVYKQTITSLSLFLSNDLLLVFLTMLRIIHY